MLEQDEKNMAEEERNKAKQDLQKHEDELDRAQREHDAIKSKLVALERKIIVGGENLLEKAEEQVRIPRVVESLPMGQSKSSRSVKELNKLSYFWSAPKNETFLIAMHWSADA